MGAEDWTGFGWDGGFLWDFWGSVLVWRAVVLAWRGVGLVFSKVWCGFEVVVVSLAFGGVFRV